MFENYRSSKAKEIIEGGGTWADVAQHYGYTPRQLKRAVTWKGEDKKTIRRLDRLSVENGGDPLAGKQNKAKTKTRAKSEQVVFIVTIRKLKVVLKDARWCPNDNMIVFGEVNEVRSYISPEDVIDALAAAVREGEYVKDSWAVSDSFSLCGQINRLYSYQHENPNVEIEINCGPISKYFF